MYKCSRSVYLPGLRCSVPECSNTIYSVLVGVVWWVVGLCLDGNLIRRELVDRYCQFCNRYREMLIFHFSGPYEYVWCVECFTIACPNSSRFLAQELHRLTAGDIEIQTNQIREIPAHIQAIYRMGDKTH